MVIKNTFGGSVFFRKLSRWRLLFCFQSVHFASTFCSKCPSFHSMLASLAQKQSENAPRPSVSTQIRRKTPLCGFRSDDTKIKKLFLLFFLSSCPCRRAQRAEIFVFALGFFFWNDLRAKIEAFESWKFWRIFKVSIWRRKKTYIRRKKTLL